MKKLMMALMAIVLCIGMNSCSEQVDLKSLVEKAQTEGADWSVDQWKDCYKQFIKGTKPMLQDLQKLAEKSKEMKDEGMSNLDAMAKIMEEAQALQEKYGDMEQLTKDFEKAAKASKHGKEVMNDEAFAKEVLKDLGLEGLEDLEF